MWRRPRLARCSAACSFISEGPATLSPARRCRSTASFSSEAGDSNSVAASSALRQQLEFCCLVGGWDTPCTTCPFDWRGFDPKERYRIFRRSPKLDDDVTTAMRILGIVSIHKSSDQEKTKPRLDPNAVKAAFRRKALEWHPDCNKDPEAEDRFREILDAYELLLGILSSP